MSVSIEHIVVVDGVPRTQNRNVKVRMIAQMHFDAGGSVAEIADHYGISVADVHAALAYYLDHRPFFDEIDRRNQQAFEEHGMRREEWLARIEARTQRQD